MSRQIARIIALCERGFSDGYASNVLHFLTFSHQTDTLLHQILMNSCTSFQKKRDAGGFQLLKTRGCTRTKILEPVPCPDEGYSPEYLCSDAVGIGVANNLFKTPAKKI